MKASLAGERVLEGWPGGGPLAACQRVPQLQHVQPRVQRRLQAIMPHAPGGHAPQRAPLWPGRRTTPAAVLASSPGGRRAGSAHHPASSAAAHARRLPPPRLLVLQVVAAYLLAALGGNAAPAEADIKKILSSGESEWLAAC